GRGATCARGEVALIDEGHAEAAQGRVQGHAGTRNAASQHEQVEGAVCERGEASLHGAASGAEVGSRRRLRARNSPNVTMPATHTPAAQKPVNTTSSAARPPASGAPASNTATIPGTAASAAYAPAARRRPARPPGKTRSRPGRRSRKNCTSERVCAYPARVAPRHTKAKVAAPT